MNADTFQPLGSLERNGPVILAADLQPPFEGMQDFSIAKLNFAQAAYREFARRIANHFDTAHGAQNGDIQDLWVGGNLSVVIEQHRKVMASNHAFLYSQTAIADSGHDGNVSDVARIFFDHMAGTFFAWAITWMDFFDNEKGQHFLADKPRTTTEIESFRKDPTVKSGMLKLESVTKYNDAVSFLKDSSESIGNLGALCRAAKPKTEIIKEIDNFVLADFKSQKDDCNIRLLSKNIEMEYTIKHWIDDFELLAEHLRLFAQKRKALLGRDEIVQFLKSD